MTSNEDSILLTVLVYEDLHLAVAKFRGGVEKEYAAEAAMVRLSKPDWQRLGLHGEARLELVSEAGSVVVVPRPDPVCEEGLACMPSSLYTNRLMNIEPGSLAPIPLKVEVRASASRKEITPISDLVLRKRHA